MIFKLEISSTTYSTAIIAAVGLGSNKNSFPVNQLKYRALPCDIIIASIGIMIPSETVQNGLQA